ncbi:hypothetical protein TIFTF001_029559 [Ficus carica]|uniref:Uncharacterized protein n=1 Tax=Ficus carica TaxID=3494 RepID=A0AA88J3J6_FICCA|nr:hypothetical protein TIFTF001_029559 [Ficus carica]
MKLEEAEKRLQDSESKLARLRGVVSSKNNEVNGTKSVKVEKRSISPVSSKQPQSKAEPDSGTKRVKVERRSTSPVHVTDGPSRKQLQSKPELLIPAVTPKVSQPVISASTKSSRSSASPAQVSSLVSNHSNDAVKEKGDKTLRITSDCEIVQKQEKGTKRKLERKEHKELIPLCFGWSGQLVASSIQGRARVTFLEDKPHLKGIINGINFLPWENASFVTGGSDHAVVLWNEKDDNVWKPKALHKHLHSSAVMGVAGMQQKHIVLSAGADKRIVGFDVHVGRADFKHQIDSKCMSVLPNPRDFNLFMVHAGMLERQLRLFDIRLRQTEIHAFGWKQESSESQSALINQSWSPDGLYITSGSADPMIHLFDIRYNASKPSQSISAHHKRVFKAVWLESLPLLVSISSDLNIGLHKVT